jgi:flagellar biosynthesis/type III secretory pathway ATPase
MTDIVDPSTGVLPVSHEPRATYKKAEDLINIGAYAQGSNPPSTVPWR